MNKFNLMVPLYIVAGLQFPMMASLWGIIYY